MLSKLVVTAAQRQLASYFDVSSLFYNTILTLLPSTSQLAVADLVEASSDADILVFVIPHQFVGKVCDTIKGEIKGDALGISLIKV